MHLRLLSTFILSPLPISLAFVFSNSTCGGCTVQGGLASPGTQWTPIFYFWNETAYIEVDVTDNSTSTISVEANTNAESEFVSACNSVSKLYAAVHNGGECLSDTVFVEEYFDYRSPETVWSITGTFPTSYLNVWSLSYYTAYWTTDESGSTVCSYSDRTIPVNSIYSIRPSDTNWIHETTLDGTVFTVLDELPYAVFSGLEGGNLSSCVPATNPGVPTTKIPILATRSTVFNYKTGSPKNAASTPVATKAPVAGPSPSNNGPAVTKSSSNNDASKAQSLPSPPVITSPPETTRLPTAPYSILPKGAGLLLPNGETLKPGTAITISGYPYSLSVFLDHTALLVGGVNLPLPSMQPSQPQLPSGYSVLPTGGVLLPNGETLKPGADTTVNGVVVSLAASVSALVISGVTMDLAPATTAQAALLQGFSVLPGGVGVVLPNGKTLSVNGETMVGGVSVALKSSGVMVVGSSTVTITSESTALPTASDQGVNGPPKKGESGKSWNLDAAMMSLVTYAVFWIFLVS